jgi:hypothetical protein
MGFVTLKYLHRTFEDSAELAGFTQVLPADYFGVVVDDGGVVFVGFDHSEFPAFVGSAHMLDSSLADGFYTGYQCAGLAIPNVDHCIISFFGSNHIIFDQGDAGYASCVVQEELLTQCGPFETGPSQSFLKMR